MASILVIDDEPMVRSLLCGILVDEGHEVREAPDAPRGIEAFRSAPADIVITDIVMPGMDGLELIMELWRDYPEVKVIAVSGGDARLSPEICLEQARIFGALQTMKKPIRRHELVEKIAELMHA